MIEAESGAVDLFIDESLGKGDVLLVVSPLHLTKTPSFSLHLLQAVCREEGITTDVWYSNLNYSRFIGADIHNKIVREERLLFGESLFVSGAFGHAAVAVGMNQFSHPAQALDYSWEINPCTADQVPEVFAPYREWVDTLEWEHLEDRSTRWIQSAAQRIANMGYRVVGCSTTPGGLNPAIALLKNIKEANAHVITVLGGALCDEEMAEGILSLKAGIDYIFSGEGEITFPVFIKKILAGHLPGEKIIYGEPAANLDAIPVPDYREYFHQLKKLPPDQQPGGGIDIPYETSRGCWYGKCTFCGLNEKKNFYREKSPARILDALKALNARYDINAVMMTDNIMPYRYFDTLLPRVSKEISSINIHYEIKANLTLEQVLTLKKAGVTRIGPGIESLSPSLLKRMRKGVTARENIALLRYVRSVNIDISWYLMFGFPGDEVKEYEEMLELFPLIHHLPPPQRMNPMTICRFSPYQAFPEMFAISDLRPVEFYKMILPWFADLEKIAYFFTGTFPAQSHENPGIIIALAKEFQAWKRAWAAYEMVPLEMMRPTLHITQKSESEYVLEDKRGLPGRPEQMVLDRLQASLLLIPRPLGTPADYQWAVDAQLGVIMESWFVPLVTAEPNLLLKFERDYQSGN